MTLQELQQKCTTIRQYILASAYHAGGAHIAPAFSATELLCTLYYQIMNFNLGNYQAEDRDRFVLSKGHGCSVLYAILADQGFFPKQELQRYCSADSILGGHPDMHKVPGVEASTGALGHGLSIAAGMALASKMKKTPYQVYTLLGDGECQEGSIWEAAMFAGHHQLQNLTAIIDYNQLQGMGDVNQINKLEPFADKWTSFGWEVKEVDGHDLPLLQATFKSLPLNPNKPNLILAHTTKGKGVSFIENKAIWHYRLPKDEEMETACQELNITDIEKVLL